MEPYSISILLFLGHVLRTTCETIHSLKLTWPTQAKFYFSFLQHYFFMVYLVVWAVRLSHALTSDHWTSGYGIPYHDPIIMLVMSYLVYFQLQREISETFQKFLTFTTLGKCSHNLSNYLWTWKNINNHLFLVYLFVQKHLSIQVQVF